MVFLESRKNLLVGNRWSLLGRLVPPKGQKEPPNRQKVGSPRRVVSPGETLQLGTMMSPWIGHNTTGKGKWGFLKQYRGCFSHERRGIGPKERLIFVG
jgi:hypothetical protein